MYNGSTILLCVTIFVIHKQCLIRAHCSIVTVIHPTTTHITKLMLKTMTRVRIIGAQRCRIDALLSVMTRRRSRIKLLRFRTTWNDDDASSRISCVESRRNESTITSNCVPVLTRYINCESNWIG
jgi:hypothetical protein